jgi:hypothetical protein
MQYTLASRIPTHPTFPAFLKYLPSVEIRKLDSVALWASHVVIIMRATQTVSHQVECVTRQLIPKTPFTRWCVRELKNDHNSVTVQNQAHVYINFFDH